MNDPVIDRIYEAAFLPEVWPSVLQTLSDRVEASGAGLVIDRPGRDPSLSATRELWPALTGYCESGAWRASELTTYARHAPPATFLLDKDFFPGDLMQREADAALIPLGEDALMGTVFSMPSGETAAFLIQRRPMADLPDDEALTWLNSIRPHLGRAALISGRLHLERATNTVQTLSQLGLPAAVLTANGSALAVNERFEALKSTFMIGAFNRLSMISPSGNALFTQAVTAAGASSAVVKSIPVRAREDDPALIVHVAPIERDAHDIFDQAATLVVITPIGLAPNPDGAMLHGLFDLTPAEARLVQKLAQGMTVQQVALDLGLAIPTLRAQLRSIFAKTGSKGQSDLGRLVGSMSPLRAAT